MIEIEPEKYIRWCILNALWCDDLECIWEQNLYKEEIESIIFTYWINEVRK